MEENNHVICTLIIPSKYYLELNDEGKSLFVKKETSHYATEFPADVREDSYLGEFIQAFCEVVLIMCNPKYQTTKESDVCSELLQVGQTEESFSLLVDIRYPGVEKLFHDVLLFKECSQSPGFYTFELLGDQTMFSVD